MLKKMLMKGFAITLIIILATCDGALAKTILAPDYGEIPPALPTVNDIISVSNGGTNFAPTPVAGKGVYNFITEWNGYMFAVSCQGDDSTYAFKDSYIEVYDIKSGGVGTSYAKWTAEQLQMSASDIITARPNKMVGIYVDDSYIYVAVYYGQENNGILYVYENNVGKENGNLVPARIADDSVLNGTEASGNPQKITQFSPTVIGNLDPRWLSSMVINKIDNYLVAFSPQGHALTYIAMINVGDPHTLKKTGNSMVHENTIFKYTPIGGGTVKNPNTVAAIEFAGKYAYVVCTDSQTVPPTDILYVVDFSKPTAPAVISTTVWPADKCDATTYNTKRAIKVSGNYAYVTTMSDSNLKEQYLYILDISDKTAPAMNSEVPGVTPAQKGGIPLNLATDGTVKNYTVGIGSAQIFGDFIVGFSTNNQAMDFYRLEMNSQKTALINNKIVTHSSSGITDQIRNTFVYGNKIYYNLMGIYSATKPERLGYVTLTPAKTYGITIQQTPFILEKGLEHIIKGTVYDGSMGNVDKIKLTIVKDNETPQIMYVTPDFGLTSDAFVGKWSYTLPSTAVEGNYKITAEAAATWEGSENINLTGAADAVEFSVKPGKRFEIVTTFSESAGTVTAAVTVTNTTDAAAAYTPVIALYTNTGVLKDIKLGTQKNIAVGTVDLSSGTIDIANYSVGNKVRVYFLKDINNLQPAALSKAFPVQ